MTIGVTISRLYLNYHTPIQVIVGILVGISSGSFWYALLGHVELLFSRVVQSPLGQLLELELHDNKIKL